MVKVDICISEVDLNDYLNGKVSGKRKSEIEAHFKSCDPCLEKLVFAYKTVEEFNKIKKSLPAGSPHGEAVGRQGVKPMPSNWKRNLWLVGAIITFVLSFFAPRYFVQLLVATILMGTKWIFDSVNARILIMIYDAWKKGDKDEASKVLQNLNNRRF